jgi:predicted alpha/beta superfamily hydrolase
VEVTEAAPVAIPRAKQYDLTSAINGRTYRVFVSTPFGAEAGKRYPVVYFIDGNWYFGPATYNETESGGANSIEHAIIVGVGYPTEDNSLVGSRRAFELTPSSPPKDKVKGEFGGAEAFLRVFDDEIIPFVNAHYPVDEQRQSLYGKSFGGLFALYQLFKKPEQFSTYIIVSPAIRWNDRDILKLEPAFASRVKAGELNLRILFTVAADESPDLIKDAKAMADRFAALIPAKTHVEYASFAGEGHVSVSLASVGRALFFALPKR